MELPKPPQGNNVICVARRLRYVLHIVIVRTCFMQQTYFKIHALLVRENIMAFVFSMAYENALQLDF
jgi:hypothetical protein